jgi:multiple sugar transport system permease protein
MATETDPKNGPATSDRLESSIGGQVHQFVNKHTLAFMIGPALLVILAIFIYPVLFLIYQSFILTVPGIPDQFAGLENYMTMLQSNQFWEFFRQTLIYSTGSLIITVVSGLTIALGINQVKRKWLRNTYSTLLMLAWAIPIAVVALIWRQILLGTEFGALNMLLMNLGIISSPVALFSNPDLALIIVLLVDAWARMPFAMVVFLAGLQSIPQHLYDAAYVDGATSLQSFRAVTLPRLRPYFAIVGLITWMFAFRAFAIIFPMTNGGPGSRTTVLSIHIYRKGMVNLNFGYAAAVAVFLVVVTVVVATGYVTQIIGSTDQ